VSDGSFDTSLGGVVDAVLVTLTLPPVAAPEIPAPTTDRLQLACSPNPFRGVTEIRYSLPVASAVAITVHEVAGRLVRTLAANEQTVAGPHRISWDGRDDTGLLAAGGVYFVRVKTTEREEAEHVVLLR
jgi:hypothetical protein